jgi:hypothetical protein
MGPTALESARESQAADRNAAIGQKYGPIAQRIAEAGDAAGVTDYAAVQAPRERYKNEARRQLENRRRFEDDTLAGEKLAQAERRQTESNQDFRERVANAPGAQARRDKEQSRLERWQAISMLAGGNPSRQQFATGNALMMLPEGERNQSIQYMLPGGQLAASVDGRQLDMAAELAQRTVMGALAGTAQGPLAAAQAEMAQLQAQAERDKLRRDGENTLADKYAREWYFGYDEFTVDEQQQMYDDLLGQGYKPADAQRAVDRVAKERRATKRKRWNAE